MIDHSEVGPRVKLAFERESVVANVDDLVPLRMLRPGTKDTKKYLQIVRSIRAIGLVELPVITPDPNTSGRYFLLDGQLRIEALKDLGITEVECIISTDDETYTYNKKVNRIVPVQEHRMIMRAVERGVSEAQIAEALGWEITSVRRRSRMLRARSLRSGCRPLEPRRFHSTRVASRGSGGFKGQALRCRWLRRGLDAE
jgi:ParB-like chromosome segregation protein Spo0J